MILENLTNYPDKEVKKLVKFAFRGHNTDRVAVLVKYCTRKNSLFQARVYFHIPKTQFEFAKGTTAIFGIKVSLPLIEKYPISPYQHYIKQLLCIITNWQECLVLNAAHEIRHLWQLRNYYTEKKFSEVDAINYSVKILNKYRKSHGEMVESGQSHLTANEES